MPGMNGLELSKRVRAIRPDLPVIVASGFTGNFRGDYLRAEGVAAVLEKPFVLPELARTLARHVLGR
jgi:CheY-like chemotaxis protein